MNIDFSNKTALVTGATRGIGKQIAEDLHALGACLILTGKDKAAVARLNDEAAAEGKRMQYHAVDFTDKNSVQRFVKDIAQEETIDVCINNAGINRVNLIDETDLADWDDIRNVNLEAPYFLTREISKGMKERGYGRIVNVASIFGVISKTKRSLYSMTKFGLRGLTVSSAIDLAPYNVLVNAVSPGFVLTELTKRILTEDERKALAKDVPMGRFAQPEEISKVVLFLASDQNTYISGQNILVDGGYVNV